jgi:hypothetical protein
MLSLKTRKEEKKTSIILILENVHLMWTAVIIIRRGLWGFLFHAREKNMQLVHSWSRYFYFLLFQMYLCNGILVVKICQSVSYISQKNPQQSCNKMSSKPTGKRWMEILPFTKPKHTYAYTKSVQGMNEKCLKVEMQLKTSINMYIHGTYETWN